MEYDYPEMFDKNGNAVKFACGGDGDGDVYKPSVFINSKCYGSPANKSSTSKPDPMRVYYAYGLKSCIGGAQRDVDGSGTPHPSITDSRAD
ncbi:uncharacterized protein GLRG_02661 [Colletotrichum graminicola M1.001]|uniref:Uncharacterized protein n=1 Tax=Colletotrichum graminicola (strain M1.001 / M2 / FGSC 10212) TaxID=645133 RepID=E3Q7K3_COLGM|nr:uncharacterized protein GLRG_02661 [Colletotrichum graminicola M1.001]EFQ26841.1 hypothetical protein GLRG_02661 [Colletotrichum graminicola M1.001]